MFSFLSLSLFHTLLPSLFLSTFFFSTHTQTRTDSAATHDLNFIDRSSDQFQVEFFAAKMSRQTDSLEITSDRERKSERERDFSRSKLRADKQIVESYSSVNLEYFTLIEF